MDTSNLSFLQVLLTVLGSFLIGGIGLAVGWKILPSFKANFKGAKNLAGEKENTNHFGKIQTIGRLFPTEILGLEGNVVRYRDGSFSKAYRFEPANTLYDDERLTELRVEESGRRRDVTQSFTLPQRFDAGPARLSTSGDESDSLRRSRQKRKCKGAGGDGLDSRSDKASGR
jgi:hypothetical protein